MGEVDEPILYLGTTHNSLFTPAHEDYHQFFVNSTAYAQETTFLVGDHVSFVGDIAGPLSGVLHFPFGATAEFDNLLLSYSVRYSVAWLKVHVAGDPSFETYLTGPRAHQDAAEGWIQYVTIN
jgi:hypothetical protein